MFEPSWIQIEKELSAIERGEPRSWGAVATLLDEIEASGYWSRNAKSFTGWLEAHACLFGVKPAMLWRSLTAGRFARQMVSRLKKTGATVPSFDGMAGNVGPESVELLAKLARVMTFREFSALAEKVFAGEVTRSQLRSSWQAYRPILNGKTARGRGYNIPRIDPKDPDQYRSLAEARALDSLKAAGPGWLGAEWLRDERDVKYQMFLHVNPEGQEARRARYLFPAVAAVQPQGCDVEYHGFSYFPLYFEQGKEEGSGQSLQIYCDYLWAIVPPPNGHQSTLSHWISKLAEYIGLISPFDGAVEVIRLAGKGPKAGLHRDRLISSLLARFLGGGM